MKYLWFLIFTASLLLVLSCEDESYIEHIKISNTIPMGSQADTQPVINNALVSLIKNNRSYELIPSSGDSGYYHYEGADLAVEEGDNFTIHVDYFGRRATGSTIDPSPTSIQNVYAHPYEEFRIELRPSAGAVLTLERQLPAVYSDVMVID